MKKLIIVLLLGIVLSFVPSSSIKYVRAEESTTEEIIIVQARYYGVSAVDMLRVAKCESDLLQTKNGVIVKGQAGELGIFQYMPSTFKWFSQMLGEELNINSKYDQIRLTAFAFSKGLQRHWTCSRIVGIL